MSFLRGLNFKLHDIIVSTIRNTIVLSYVQHIFPGETPPAPLLVAGLASTKERFAIISCLFIYLQKNKDGRQGLK